MTAPAVWRRGSALYPRALGDIPSPPAQLYALGERAGLDAPCVAIVGTRRPTRYGEDITREIAGALARAGACIVSGMAFGVDAAAHRAALDAGGHTVAVLAAGIDRVYPSAHRRLYDELLERGLVVAEFPPGHAPFDGCFPRRNRIIAGLAAATIVVEAGERSGALITANYALDAGRTVAAVPGRIDSPQSAGTNRLIADGAQVIASIDDALALTGAMTTPPAHAGLPAMDGDELVIWDELGRGRSSIDDLVIATGWPAARCMAAVTSLEIMGAVRVDGRGEAHPARAV